MSSADDFVDLLASGDAQRIECVLFAAMGGAVTGGLGAGIAFAPSNVVPVAGQAFNATAAAIGAVLGSLAAGRVALNYCGGDATKGSLQRLFDVSKAPMEIVAPFESAMREEFSLSATDARLLAKAAIVYNANGFRSTDSASDNDRKNAVALLLTKLKKA
jgi:hypothetical protein